MNRETNPYRVPQSDLTAPPIEDESELGDLENIRRAHLNAETNVRVIGGLSILGALMMLTNLLLLIGKAPGAAPDLTTIAVQTVSIAAAGLIGFFLMRLSPVARILYTISSGILLLGTAVALFGGESAAGGVLQALFAILFLWILWNAKGRMVFSSYYRTVVQPRTQHIQRKTNKAFVVIGLLIAALILLGMLSMLLGG